MVTRGDDERRAGADAGVRRGATIAAATLITATSVIPPIVDPRDAVWTLARASARSASVTMRSSSVSIVVCSPARDQGLAPPVSSPT